VNLDWFSYKKCSDTVNECIGDDHEELLMF
jgi:hypothetical protein